jgi:hypothetical protein
MMRLWLFLNPICFIVLLFSGCAYFTHPKEKPVEHDWAGPMFRKKTTHVFSMTPERRTVIVMPKAEEEKTKFCAEPPPDVAESLVNTLQFLAQASVKDPKFKIDTEFYKAFTATPRTLFVRSQGAQLFRDGLYNLCQACINGAITKEEYGQKYMELLNKATSLIEQEIPLLSERKVTDAIDTATKAADEAKAASNVAKDSAASAQKAVEEVRKILREMQGD